MAADLLTQENLEPLSDVSERAISHELLPQVFERYDEARRCQRRRTRSCAPPPASPNDRLLASFQAPFDPVPRPLLSPVRPHSLATSPLLFLTLLFSFGCMPATLWSNQCKPKASRANQTSPVSQGQSLRPNRVRSCRADAWSPVLSSRLAGRQAVISCRYSSCGTGTRSTRLPTTTRPLREPCTRSSGCRSVGGGAAARVVAVARVAARGRWRGRWRVQEQASSDKEVQGFDHTNADTQLVETGSLKSAPVADMLEKIHRIGSHCTKLATRKEFCQ
eukprot:2768263-Pleurochrysis_carterae.AAC.7